MRCHPCVKDRMRNVQGYQLSYTLNQNMALTLLWQDYVRRWYQNLGDTTRNTTELVETMLVARIIFSIPHLKQLIYSSKKPRTNAGNISNKKKIKVLLFNE